LESDVTIGGLRVGWRRDLLAAMLALAAGAAEAQSRIGNAEDCANPNIPADRAERACSAALTLPGQPQGAIARLLANRGGARLDLGRHLAALDDFDKALAIEPTMFVAMTGRARALVGLGRSQEGIAQFDEALAQSPRDANALMGRGAAQLAIGNAEAALGDFDKALKAAPKDLDARYNRGVAKLALGDKAGASEDFSAVIRGAPNDAAAHLMRAKTRAGEKDPLALADLQRAVALDPEWAQAWFERGKQFDRMGRTEEANRDFRRAFELGYEDRWLQERILAIGR
jgi:tetratricopeptide (TPR) repeat protein